MADLRLDGMVMTTETTPAPVTMAGVMAIAVST